MQNLEETGPYIWLRYTTQFQRDGQTQTIELSVPVPVGASAERREQLFREAEAGMAQMVQHVGRRLPQLLARPQSSTSPSASSAPSAPTQPQHRAEQGGAQQAAPAQATKSAPVSASVAPRPASLPAPQTTPQGSLPTREIRESRAEAVTRPEVAIRREEIVVPPTRPNIGASMPLTLGPTLDSSGNLSISEFIKYIRENLGLDARQAMQMLGVRTLQGVNLREALDRLKVIVTQRHAAGSLLDSQPGAPAGKISETSPPHVDTVASDDDKVHPPVELEETEEEQTTRIIEMRVPAAAPSFDEELDPDEADILADDDEPLEEGRDLSPQLVEQAHTRINELREHQGASTASPKRLQALNNVMDTQISEEQLEELIFGVWNVSALKKLKVDQVEALISWAKQDYFIDEVEAVLYVLEEERYARGNR